MKACVCLAAAVGVLACTTSTCQAARFAATTNGNVASFYIKGDSLNNHFDTVDFKLIAVPPFALTNPSSGAGPRPPGDPFTYVNRVLDADPLDGGLGWSILGLTNTATELSFAGGPLGQKIDTGDDAGPGLFLANIHLNDRAIRGVVHVCIRLIDAGNVVFEDCIVPEPASAGLTCVAVLGLLALRNSGSPSHQLRSRTKP